MCGENIPRKAFRPLIAGSSPRVRGKHSHNVTGQTDRGLIPACAGKTWTSTTARRDEPAHPRVCGENVTAGVMSCQATGSSPRVRGKRRSRPLSPPRARLIPACAGKTCFFGGLVGHLTAHPRVCGENGYEPVNPASIDGSSPRVRGKLGCPL